MAQAGLCYYRNLWRTIFRVQTLIWPGGSQVKKPREQRVGLKLAVRVWGMDAAGQLFGIDARTVDITPVGACIEGPFGPLERGSIVGVRCGRSHARFRVVWVGGRRTKAQIQICVRCIEPGKNILGVTLERKIDETSDQPAGPPLDVEVSQKLVSG